MATRTDLLVGFSAVGGPAIGVVIVPAGERWLIKRALWVNRAALLEHYHLYDDDGAGNLIGGIAPRTTMPASQWQQTELWAVARAGTRIVIATDAGALNGFVSLYGARLTSPA